jgi:hypothetical protein
MINPNVNQSVRHAWGAPHKDNPRGVSHGICVKYASSHRLKSNKDNDLDDKKAILVNAFM